MLKEKKNYRTRDIRVFGNVRVLCSAAILAAAAVAIAYICKFMTIGPIRVTFENLPIILSGYVFGPWIGLVTGLGADILSTAVSQYGLSGINPLITAGAGAVGMFAGIFSRLLYSKKKPLRLGVSVGVAHIIGNMIIKSAGLMIYYSYPINLVILRIPLYTAIAAIEFGLLLALLSGKGMSRVLGGLGYDI